MCSLLRSTHRERKRASTTFRVQGALEDALLNEFNHHDVRSGRRFFTQQITEEFPVCGSLVARIYRIAHVILYE